VSDEIESESASASEDHDELVYELPEWTPELRGELGLLLDRENIPYQWEGGTDLIVPAADEDRVDALLDEIEQGVAELPPVLADDLDDETRYAAISELFGVSDRLSHKPGDVALCGDFIDAASIVRELPAPYGVTDDVWWGVQTRIRSVTEAIEMEAEDEAVAQGARTLAELLRSFV
jgi:hypothetical protein